MNPAKSEDDFNRAVQKLERDVVRLQEDLKAILVWMLVLFAIALLWVAILVVKLKELYL